MYGMEENHHLKLKCNLKCKDSSWALWLQQLWGSRKYQASRSSPALNKNRSPLFSPFRPQARALKGPLCVTKHRNQSTTGTDSFSIPIGKSLDLSEILRCGARPALSLPGRSSEEPRATFSGTCEGSEEVPPRNRGCKGFCLYNVRRHNGPQMNHSCLGVLNRMGGGFPFGSLMKVVVLPQETHSSSHWGVSSHWENWKCGLGSVQGWSFWWVTPWFQLWGWGREVEHRLRWTPCLRPPPLELGLILAFYVQVCTL